MKPSHLFTAAAAVLALAGCNAESGNSTASSAPIEAVPPPEGGDWSQMVRQTPEGGFVMGNPDADVKLVEFASMTCPHCADFEENGVPPLIENYVKTGRVSFELRNFVRDPFDLTASLITRCGGADRYFPLTRAMFEDQDQWFQTLQNIPQDQMQSVMTMGPQQQFLRIAELAGFQQWAAQRGLPSAQSTQCLTNEEEVNRLVQMNSDATSNFNIPGTPSFVINGELVENASAWDALEPRIREALGS